MAWSFYTANMLSPSEDAAPRVAMAGAGPVAQALGRALAECGVSVDSVASRDPDHATAAAAFIGGGAVAVQYSEIPHRASHVIVCVSDRAIAPVTEQLAGTKGRLRVALHTSGTYGPELLAPLRAGGVSCGAIHPLQTIRDPRRGAAALRAATSFAVSGDPEAKRWADDIARRLGGRILHIRPEARHLYHAAAVMASNYVAVLLDCAAQLMTLAGVPEQEALPALGPLVRASLDNVLECGAIEALTGPIVRGDAATVAEHTRALQQAEPSIAALYEAAGRNALLVARRRGLSESDAEAVLKALLARR